MSGYYKTELVRGPARPGPWLTVEDLEEAFYAGQTTAAHLFGTK